MSGIFAYMGTDQAKDILLKGIGYLEKRGADTTGIVLKNEDSFAAVKTKGTASDLKMNSKNANNKSVIGIAECSDEYRCKASPVTASPSSNNLYAAALDGCIENFDSLKKWTREPFPIATDEDLLLACLCIINEKNKIEMITGLSKSFTGNPSFAFISSDENAIYCKSGNSDFIIGTAENGVYLASELNALIPFCEKYTILSNGEIARIAGDKITFFDMNQKKLKKALFSIPEQSYFENNYLLADEIYNCSLAARETYNYFVKNAQFNFDYLKLNRRGFEKINRIIVAGSGGSKNAAYYAKYIFEMLCDIPVDAVDSGEFRYSQPQINKNTLFLAISHRGENADTLACVRKVKASGAKAIGITSNKTSALARECNAFINPNCDFDFSGISLRSYISNCLAICFFALYIGGKCGIVTELYLGVAIKMAEMLSGKISSAIKNTPQLEAAAEILINSHNVFITGIGADYALSLEAAQKIREITGINAFSVCCGELAEYPKELLSSSTVIALITNKELLQKALSRIRKMQTVGADVIIFTTENIEEEITDFSKFISFNDTLPILNPLTCIASVYKTAVLANEMKEQEGAPQSA